MSTRRRGLEHHMLIARRGFLAVCAVIGVGCCAGSRTGAREEFVFVQMCDTQLGMGGYEHDVETFKQAVNHINMLKPDFVVICGDLINTTEDDQAFADFNGIKSGFEMPCYCAAGNHDVGNAPTAELLERYRALVGRDYYTLNHKGCVFVVVNTQLWKAPVEGESAKHDAWFKRALQAASERGAPVFVVGHYPLYLAEPDEAEEYFNLPVRKRKELLALFERHGVVAMLSGHVHRNIVNTHGGIQFVSSATTSRNFDGAPMGFRVWRIGTARPYAHEFVAVEGASPPASPLTDDPGLPTSAFALQRFFGWYLDCRTAFEVAERDEELVHGDECAFHIRRVVEEPVDLAVFGVFVGPDAERFRLRSVRVPLGFEFVLAPEYDERRREAFLQM